MISDPRRWYFTGILNCRKCRDFFVESFQIPFLRLSFHTFKAGIKNGGSTTCLVLDPDRFLLMSPWKSNWIISRCDTTNFLACFSTFLGFFTGFKGDRITSYKWISAHYQHKTPLPAMFLSPKALKGKRPGFFNKNTPLKFERQARLKFDCLESSIRRNWKSTSCGRFKSKTSSNNTPEN